MTTCNVLYIKDTYKILIVELLQLLQDVLQKDNHTSPLHKPLVQLFAFTEALLTESDNSCR